jgi:3D (Asp-Asp-Asp) domain-containing protein
MITIGPDTGIPATAVQRVARRVLIGGCGVLAAGTITSVARLATAPPPRDGHGIRSRLLVDQGPLSVMAAARPAASPKVTLPDGESTRADPNDVELVHAVFPPAATPGQPRVVWMLVTAYCPCAKCCGPNATGLTASGKPTSANYGHFAAAPAELPFGSKLVVPGYNKGKPIPVLDRGGAIKGRRLDVFFASHEAAKAWGRRWVAVTLQP